MKQHVRARLEALLLASLGLLNHVGLGNGAADGLGHDTTDKVGVDVGGGSSVLKVAVALLGNGSGDSDGAASVGNTRRKGADGAGLVSTSQSHVVVLAVDGNVLLVSGRKLLDGSLNVLHSTGLSHRLGRHVGVAAGAVPVALQGLGVERDLDAKLLGHSVQQVSGHPQLVGHGDALAGADLVLPLGRHHLGVDAGDVDAGVQTGSVVGLNNVSGKDLASTNTTVVGALGSGEAALGPSNRVVALVEHGVLLLDSEPDDLLLVGAHEFGALVSVVELVGGSIVVPALGQHNDVVASSERIGVDGGGSEIDIRVVAGRLFCGGSVKVPLGEILDGFGLLAQSLALGSDVELGVNPDVLGKHSSVLGEFQVFCELG